MQLNKFTDEQILSILNEAEAGAQVEEVCRRHGIGHSTFYKWRHKYQGMTPDLMSHIRMLEEENTRLKRLYADLSLEHQALKDILRKKL